MGVNVNGNDFGWGSITLKLNNGQIFDGFTKIAYGDKRTRGKGYSAGRHHAPTHRSSGKYEIDPIKITGYKEELQQLRAALAAQSADGVSYGNVEFEGQVQFQEGNTLHQIDLHRLVWFEDAAAHEESPDLLTEEVSFDPMRLERDGLCLYDATEGVPL